MNIYALVHYYPMPIGDTWQTYYGMHTWNTYLIKIGMQIEKAEIDKTKLHCGLYYIIVTI